MTVRLDDVRRRITAAGGDEAPAPYYGSTNEFVRDHLRHVYKRKINGQNTFWSPRWWASTRSAAGRPWA